MSPSSPVRSVIDKDSWRSCPECSQISAEPARDRKEGWDPKLSPVIRAASPSRAPALQLQRTHDIRMALCLWACPCWQPTFPALTGEEGHNCSHPGTDRAWALKAAELWPSLLQGSYFVCFLKWCGGREIWRGFMGKKSLGAGISDRFPTR